LSLARTLAAPRVDRLRVAELVADGSRVLDVGCDDGELVRLLVEERNVDGRGIELSQQGVNDCVAKGLSVIQGDADTDLIDYPNDAFDYVILSRPCRPHASRASCSSTCCGSVAGPSFPCRISAIGGLGRSSP
jgi:SAM-dependent methyltransferase